MYEANSGRNRFVVCLGDNSDGQLGIGDGSTEAAVQTPADRLPVELHTGEVPEAIAAGYYHTCVLYTSGSLSCWGKGSNGQLGLGTSESKGLNEKPSALPLVALPTGRHAVQMCAGSRHTCAVFDDATLRCWGSFEGGALGYTDVTLDGRLPAELPPVDLSAGRSAVQVACGQVHTCALRDDATVSCWGIDNSGRLGRPLSDPSTPIRMPFDMPIMSLAAGSRHTCATAVSGAMICWGESASGQLGRGSTGDVGDSQYNVPHIVKSFAFPPQSSPGNVVYAVAPTVPALASPTPSASVSPSVTASTSQSPSVTASVSPSQSPSVTASLSPSQSATPPAQLGGAAAATSENDNASFGGGPIVAVVLLVAAVAVAAAVVLLRRQSASRRRTARSVPPPVGPPGRATAAQV